MKVIAESIILAVSSSHIFNTPLPLRRAASRGVPKTIGTKKKIRIVSSLVLIDWIIK